MKKKIWFTWWLVSAEYLFVDIDADIEMTYTNPVTGWPMVDTRHRSANSPDIQLGQNEAKIVLEQWTPQIGNIGINSAPFTYKIKNGHSWHKARVWQKFLYKEELYNEP